MKYLKRIKLFSMLMLKEFYGEMLRDFSEKLTWLGKITVFIPGVLLVSLCTCVLLIVIPIVAFFDCYGENIGKAIKQVLSSACRAFIRHQKQVIIRNSQGLN